MWRGFLPYPALYQGRMKAFLLFRVFHSLSQPLAGPAYILDFFPRLCTTAPTCGLRPFCSFAQKYE